MATPPIPRLRPEVLAALIQQMQQSMPMPRLRPEPDQLGTGNTNMMPRLRPSAEQQPPLPTPPLPMPTAADPNLMASPAPRPTYSDTSIRRMREADYRVRLAKDEPAGSVKEGTGHGVGGAHPQRRAMPPRPSNQRKAMPLPQVAGLLSPGVPMNPGSAAGLRGILSALQPAQAAGPDFTSGFEPSMETPPEIAQAAAMEQLKMQLFQMMLGARIPQQSKPWVRSDQAADAAPQGGFTTPSGMYR